MLIDFIPSRSKLLYQRISDNTLTFTSNNNLNLRLPRNERQGIYLDEMTGGEDVYLCINLLRQSKKYLIDNDIKMYHKPRSSVSSLLHQFYNYGKFSSDALGNLKLTQLEFFYLWNLMDDEFRFFTKFWFPIRGLIYLSYSFIHQITLILGLLLFNKSLLMISTFAVLMMLLREIPLLIALGPWKGIKTFFVSYLVNWAFLLGSCRNTFKNRVVFVPPQLRRSKFDYSPEFKIFGKSKIPAPLFKSIAKQFQAHDRDPSSLEIINPNIFRFRTQTDSVIIKKYSFFISFYKIIDYYAEPA